MESCILKSPLGYVKIVGDTNGISTVAVLNSENKETDIIPTVLEDCAIQLKENFEGKRKKFTLKLNAQGTAFQTVIWELLQEIPYGKTLSYLQLSRRLGDTKAIRATANAIGKNPLWIIVPCHRIIGSDGRLTGYANGLHPKQWLIAHESPHPQLSLF